MKRSAEEKKVGVAEAVAATGLGTYIRSSDGAVMVQIAPHSFLNAEHFALASGRSRPTGH